MRSNRAIVVVSCDKFSNLWTPFFSQFFKFWPDCPYPIYLGSNTISYTKDKRVKVILSGKDVDWSTSLKSILTQVPEKFLFLWIDDAFLTGRVSNKSIDACFNFLEQDGVRHIRFGLPTYSGKSVAGGKFVEYPRGAPDRTSNIGFWRKDEILDILLPGESPWNFEIMGAYRSSYHDGYYSPSFSIFRYLHVVEKGKIRAEAVQYCQIHGIKLSGNRTVLKADSKLISDVKIVWYKIMLKIPWKWRVSLMALFRKLLVSY